MADREIVAEGVWCLACEVFEEPDMVEGQCLACGCLEEQHKDVEVVTTGG